MLWVKHGQDSLISLYLRNFKNRLNQTPTHRTDREQWTKRPGCWSSVNPNTASYLHFSIEEHGHYLRSAAGLLDVIKGSPPYLFAKYHQSLLASSLSAMSASRAVSLSISQKFINYTQKHSSKQALVLQIPPPLINWV